MPETPEQKARRDIDADLTAAGWRVQDRDDIDLTVDRGTAVREFPMKPERLALLNQDLTYTANQLDRDVVAESQIRTVLQRSDRQDTGRSELDGLVYKRRERDALVVSARTPSKRERNL